ncbi:carbon monoxide dehydrogenase subunit G [Gemmobacter fulvus]|uniref:CoxG family protein n=1 Tax=Gemmobacter fulvus TaxID=2840474 RepID=UPI0027965CD2|nr:carbon monoxide dehydrogenase subunit G [Gemmobacter fulvus]MDQ1850189.1 carbon monoxide dehydrogenase subunit G [Gemmobacter fulvus]
MELSGETVIAAPIQTVWAGLNDPAILRACIPGCEALDRVSPTEMTARVVQKIGPVSASFTGHVTLSEIDAPQSYRITGQGSGGVAGFAKGSAMIRLETVEGGTKLSYSVEAALGGKIAQLGSRMIKGVANALAGQFFQRFSEVVTGGEVSATPAPATLRIPAPGAVVPMAAVAGVSWRNFALAGWATAAVFALIALLLTQQV